MSYLNKALLCECLRELGSEEQQRLLWLSSGGDVSSFEEVLEQLFSDSGLRDALDLNTVFSEEVDRKFEQLSRLSIEIQAHEDPVKIIESAAMVEVRTLSMELYNLISNQHDST